MKRLTLDPNDHEYERIRQELADHYSRPQQPRFEHTDWLFGQPSNPRNGMLTGSEYELVEMACTMSGRLAIANVEARAGGIPAWHETSRLPQLPTAPLIEEWCQVGDTPDNDEGGWVEMAVAVGLALVACALAWLSR